MKDTEGAKFVTKHTFEANTEMGATTINNAVQKAFGDKKKNVSLAFMHSAVATQLENLQLLTYLKYTDSNGIQSNLEIAQLNGKTVIVDDDMPVESGYVAATADTEGAIQVGTGTGKVTLADVKKADFYPENVAADDLNFAILVLKYLVKLIETQLKMVVLTNYIQDKENYMHQHIFLGKVLLQLFLQCLLISQTATTGR